jgi:ABC-type uncharacterized transport system permease subunit
MQESTTAPTPPTMLPSLFAWIALPAYALAAVELARTRLPDSNSAGTWARLLGLIAVAAHGAYHAWLLGRTGTPDLHFFAALSWCGLGVAALTVMVGALRRVEALGILVFPIALVLLGLFLVSHRSGNTPSNPNWQITLHAALALLGYAVLSVAALVALLLTIQERALRTHRVAQAMRRFPPLTLVESLLFRLIAAGFVLLTLTLLSGALFVENLFAQHLAHKTVLSCAAWLVFGVLLYGRWRWGWRGRRAVRLTLVGMALLLLAFFGSKFVLEIVLGRTG